jgi:hypothetical protein
MMITTPLHPVAMATRTYCAADTDDNTTPPLTIPFIVREIAENRGYGVMKQLSAEEGSVNVEVKVMPEN